MSKCRCYTCKDSVVDTLCQQALNAGFPCRLQGNGEGLDAQDPVARADCPAGSRSSRNAGDQPSGCPVIVYEQLISVDSIPPLSATASRLLVMASDPDVDIDRLCMVIERDPPLMAKIVGIANSAFYAPRQPVYTVKDAIVRVLGLRMVSNLAFGLAVGGGLSAVGCERFDVNRYWVTALGTADLASGLARASSIPGKPDPDATYLAGLLHNLGLLVLVHLRPREMNDVLAKSAEQPEIDAIDLERAVLGTDRWAAGAMLARHWQLPDVVATCIEGFAVTDGSGSPDPMVQLVRAARRWIEGALVGRSDSLQVIGVDDASCECRTAAFLDDYDALKSMADALHS